MQPVKTPVVRRCGEERFPFAPPVAKETITCKNRRPALASEPPIDETFLREVDDELRRDELVSFWRRWGRWLIGGALALLAAWGGYLWWENQQLVAAGREGEKMASVIADLTEGKEAAVPAKLAELAKAKGAGYRAAAMMTQAGLAQQRGDTKAAATGFAKLVSDQTLPKPWRDVALVRQTAAEFDTIKPEIVVERLRPLAIEGNPWFGSAGELVAIAWLRMGKPELAGKMFADIGKDEHVPESIRSRAVQMAGALGATTATAVVKEGNR